MEKKKLTVAVLAVVAIILVVVMAVMLSNKTSDAYEVTFDVGVSGLNKVIKTDKNGKITMPEVPTKEGYTFAGWYYGNEKFDFSTQITKDITLTAKWTIVEEPDNTEKVTTYTVKFNVDGGSAVKAQTIEEGKLATKPANPTKKGYTFKGWCVGDKAFDFSTKITKNITLTAKWEKQKNEESKDTEKVATYTVTFESDGGSAVKAQKVEKDKKATKPTNPTKAGYVFKGWYVGDKAFDFSSKITKNITLTAKWEKVQQEPEPVKTFTVAFVTDGGTTVQAQVIEQGKKATKPAAPTKTGYIFKGWYLNGIEFDFNTAISQDTTLTANWEKVQEQIKTYTVTFETEGGSSVKAQIVEEGKTATRPQDPKKDGYTFNGWYYNNVQFNFGTKITSNVTLVANWKKNAPITWKTEATLSDVGQIKIFVYQGDEKVDAIVDLVMNTGKVVKDQEVPKTGRVANSYKVVDVINIRVK